jgi:hypothetical protein
MTKAELKIALEAKFDKVGEFEGGYPEVLGLKRYDIKVFDYDKGMFAYTVFIEDEGSAKESISFGGKNPLEEEPVKELSFTEKVWALIEERKADGTILDAYIDGYKTGRTVAEVVVFRIVSSEVVKENYIVHQDATNELVLRKLS